MDTCFAITVTLIATSVTAAAAVVTALWARRTGLMSRHMMLQTLEQQVADRHREWQAIFESPSARPDAHKIASHPVFDAFLVALEPLCRMVLDEGLASRADYRAMFLVYVRRAWNYCLLWQAPDGEDRWPRELPSVMKLYDLWGVKDTYIHYPPGHPEHNPANML